MANNTHVNGQMTWRPNGATSTDILYLRLDPSESWRPYTDFPEYAQHDPPSFSKGYTTFIRLLKQNWQAVS